MNSRYAHYHIGGSTSNIHRAWNLHRLYIYIHACVGIVGTSLGTYTNINLRQIFYLHFKNQEFTPTPLTLIQYHGFCWGHPPFPICNSSYRVSTSNRPAACYLSRFTYLPGSPITSFLTAPPEPTRSRGRADRQCGVEKWGTVQRYWRNKLPVLKTDLAPMEPQAPPFVISHLLHPERCHQVPETREWLL